MCNSMWLLRVARAPRLPSTEVRQALLLLQPSPYRPSQLQGQGRCANRRAAPLRLCTGGAAAVKRTTAM